MPTYTVQYKDPQGKSGVGEIQAASANEAITKIKTKGFQPVKVTPKADGAPKTAASPPATAKGPAATRPASAELPPKAADMAVEAAAPPEAKKAKRGMRGILGGGVSHKQLTQFTTQLSVLINAGLPIVRSLKILSAQMKTGYMKGVIAEVAEDVEQGSQLSEAMSKHPKAFDKLYTNMVRAGEAGGVLDVILERLAQYMEKVQALRRKIIGASIYPAVVITIAVTVVLAIMTFIVPRFAAVFEQVGVQLPAMTKFLMAVSKFILSFWYVILISPVFFVIGFKLWKRTATGRYMIDKFKLIAPLFGGIVRKAVTARLTRTLGTLLQSGVPILDALNIVRGTVGNELIAAAIGKVHDSVKEGENIAGPLGECGVFDDIVVNMIDVGEETGELDKMLLKIADTYDAEVDAAVSGLVSIMEPLLIVGLGSVVGFIVVSLFMPLMSLLQGIGGGG